MSITDPIALPEDEQLVAPDLHVIARNVVAAAKVKLKDAPSSMELAAAIQNVGINYSLKEINSLTIALIDPEWDIFDSALFDLDDNGEIDPIDVNYPDGSKYWWRLTQVSPKADHTIQLTLLVREAVYLMHHQGPLKGNRAQMTRAQFLKMGSAKVKEGNGIAFHSLELRKREPIAAPDLSSGSAAGGSTGAGGVTIQAAANAWLVTASRESDGGDGACGPIGSGGIWYSELSATGGAAGRDYSALGVLPCMTPLVITNPANGKSVIAHKRDKGGGSSFMPVMGLYPGTLAALGLSGDSFHVVIQRQDGQAMRPVRGTPANGAKAGTIPGPGGSAGSTITSIQAYFFEINPHELYWDGFRRLADEVNWELFWDGRDLYYDSEMELIKQPPVATVSRDDAAVIDWGFDWDARSIVTGVTLVLICDEFAFKAGDTMQLTRFGTASKASTAKPKLPGRWLIDTWSRNKGDIFTTFQLKQPEKDKLEPAPQVSQTTVPGATGTGGAAQSGNQGIDSVISAAIAISRRNLPYTWGGGHNGSFSPGPGFDCSGYVSAILHAAGMLSSPLDSTGFESWGAPGRGRLMTVWCNSGHVFIEFTLPGSHMQANTSPGPGPHYFAWGQNGAADAASGSFTPRHFPGA